jgi:sterol desaturase/sphingolipid hydroxylase (fatty acid hydroxylase superfamily)
MASEQTLRLGAFVAVLAAAAAAEAIWPRRQRSFPRWRRWPGNLGLVVIGALLLRWLFPLAAVGLAALLEDKGLGLLPALGLPYAVSFVLAVILLDCAIYLQHVMFHAVPALWRLHRVHHADLDFDATTGVRFHPIEIVLSMIIKLMVVASLGPPALAVVAFEVLLNATSMFNHSNLRLPLDLDLRLRRYLVTPDMHRVHHSIVPHETNSNFGFNLPWWDRLFGTYREQPAAGHEAMTIGIEQFREGHELRLDRLLLQPWRGEAGSYSINRRDSGGG